MRSWKQSTYAAEIGALVGFASALLLIVLVRVLPPITAFEQSFDFFARCATWPGSSSTGPATPVTWFDFDAAETEAEMETERELEASSAFEADGSDGMPQLARQPQGACRMDIHVQLSRDETSMAGARGYPAR